MSSHKYDGRLFHASGPAAVNSCRHTYCGSRRLLIWEGEGHCRRQRWYRQLSKPPDAGPDNELCIRHATLYSTRLQTGNQCNWTSTCDMWSHRLAPVMRRVAAFWTDCNNVPRIPKSKRDLDPFSHICTAQPHERDWHTMLWDHWSQ